MPVYSNMKLFLHKSATYVLSIFQTTGSEILRKKYSIHAVTLCPVLFTVPNIITVFLPCLLNSTPSNCYCIAINERMIGE